MECAPEGEVVRESLPADVEYSGKITPTDTNHFQITASRQTFQYAIEGDKLREVAPALH